MADNVGYTPGSGALVASDEVTYSSDTSLVQLVRPVLVSGSEGSRSVVDLPGDNTNGLDVDVTRVSGNVTVVQGTASNLKTDANITNTSVAVGGTVAHDAADSGNPQKMGTRARSTVITSVATDDRADSIGTLQGYLITYPYALPQSALTGTASSTGTGDTAVIAAQGAGITINITTITVYNDSTTNTYVNIKDGATTRLVVPAPAKGGAMITLPSPLRITANTAFNFASAAGVTTMYVSAVGFAGI